MQIKSIFSDIAKAKNRRIGPQQNFLAAFETKQEEEENSFKSCCICRGDSNSDAQSLEPQSNLSIRLPNDCSYFFCPGRGRTRDLWGFRLFSLSIAVPKLLLML